MNPLHIVNELGFICSRKCFPSFSSQSSKINGSYNLNSAGIQLLASTQWIVPLTFVPVNPVRLLVSGS